jgi:hypothetical protein
MAHAGRFDDDSGLGETFHVPDAVNGYH